MKKDESMDIYFYIMGWVVLIFIAVMTVIIMIYGTGFLSRVPKCAFLVRTGYYCPGCGGTRAAFAFFKGHFIKSFIFNPIVPYAGILGGWFMISQTIERISRHRVRIALHFRDIYVWAGVAIIFANWIIKDVLLLFGIRLLG